MLGGKTKLGDLCCIGDADRDGDGDAIWFCQGDEERTGGWEGECMERTACRDGDVEVKGGCCEGDGNECC